MEKLVATCDMILSILNPAAAVTKAREVAGAIKATGRKIALVDCNAISPQTVREIDWIIREVGGIFIDAGISRSPPRGNAKPRLYVSGPDAYLFTQITHPNLNVRIMSERAGDASAVKMCYASFTKGAVALALEQLIAARNLGVDQALEIDLKDSLGDVYDWLVARIPSTPPKAYR